MYARAVTALAAPAAALAGTEALALAAGLARDERQALAAGMALVLAGGVVLAFLLGRLCARDPRAARLAAAGVTWLAAWAFLLGPLLRAANAEAGGLTAFVAAVSILVEVLALGGGVMLAVLGTLGLRRPP